MQPRAFLRVVEPKPLGQSADSAFHPDCFDFTAYLARRLGVEQSLANEVLGEWLLTYEPAAAGDLWLDSPTPNPDVAPASGVRASVGAIALLTGTDG
jgi:hypothetical protein